MFSKAMCNPSPSKISQFKRLKTRVRLNSDPWRRERDNTLLVVAVNYGGLKKLSAFIPTSNKILHYNGHTN